MMLYQQGDLLIELTENIPDKVEAVPPKDGRYILAEGEATGHAHAVAENYFYSKKVKQINCTAWPMITSHCAMKSTNPLPFLLVYTMFGR